ncbi:predicted protein [Sclerotinia sclerotiorum 1980 UF-70]|uniref:Uncharacterized protein n=1 Tax=Sclerotinia sclerotiorum (strain ATCC 18683 / 1980 / Ss-1) TaxID=665079 RepID=A7EPI7_SCLS1|nr:predicted protein [Sclerotinia sclerotiorum 1980 UF-70]EDO04753.1 predicted protein [Sclerotinia sclerotiorum 1980 UF-70]
MHSIKKLTKAPNFGIFQTSRSSDLGILPNSDFQTFQLFKSESLKVFKPFSSSKVRI